MFSRINSFMVLAALTVGSFVFTAAPAAAQDRSFKVVNQSRYTIQHIYVSPTNYSRWGFDRLGDYVLRPNYEFTLSVYPAFYDVKLIDEDGDACVISNVDFRYGEQWNLTDRLLLTCELVTAF